MPKSRQQTRTVPPAANQRIPWRWGSASELVVGAVLVMVRVAVPAVALVISTGLVVPKLSVGGSCEPVGLDVTEAVIATLPVKPPLGVTVAAFPAASLR
jgi:hypothetical protein